MTTDEIGTRNQNASADINAVTFSRLGTSPDLRVLEVSGDLDISTSGQLGQELDELLDAGIAHIDVDLAGVMFMDSSALSELVRAHERARRAGVRFKLVRPSAACTKVFGITGLDRVFDLA